MCAKSLSRHTGTLRLSVWMYLYPIHSEARTLKHAHLSFIWSRFECKRQWFSHLVANEAVSPTEHTPWCGRGRGKILATELARLLSAQYECRRSENEANFDVRLNKSKSGDKECSWLQYIADMFSLINSVKLTSSGALWFSLPLGLVLEMEHSAGATQYLFSRLSPTGYRVGCGCHEICLLKEGDGWVYKIILSYFWRSFRTLLRYPSSGNFRINTSASGCALKSKESRNSQINPFI